MTQSYKQTPLQDREMKNAMLRGFKRICPNCGEGDMFDSYLHVVDRCPACAEDLSQHRADDGPAYLTILIVGHLLAPLMIWVFTEFRPSAMTMAILFSVSTVALSLYLLPRLKGVVVGIQWSKGMHGFGQPG
ncbi:Uncharacterized conserved protein, DUF983 family [Loktanella sp. DSM 29012]|uniref:DUF983 domain-containing protein n=1 Tax=Loktanella sp. DSM 29012 TaxID=1881056 RepID=UPI0008ACC9DE|nr:DUF983 domain-containing protein [Loktanella sp. DSM 29012]SEQ63460.1 Uncharacterized conserved protein, DUF983 family [Loktanella sp. DSM 29012]